MSYRATPHTTTGLSPYYLLHAREMTLPNSENLKAKLPKEKENFDQDRRLENLKSSPQLAYKEVKKANRQSHLNNKRLYDRGETKKLSVRGHSLPVKPRPEARKVF